MQEKTRFTRRVQLASAVQNGDVVSLAELLQSAEEAHAEYEKTHEEHDVEWPTWYAQWLLCQRDSFDAACGVATPITTPVIFTTSDGEEVHQDPYQAKVWAEGGIEDYE